MSPGYPGKTWTHRGLTVDSGWTQFEHISHKIRLHLDHQFCSKLDDLYRIRIYKLCFNYLNEQFKTY